MHRSFDKLNQYGLVDLEKAALKGGGQYIFVDDGDYTHIYWQSDSGTLTYIRTLYGRYV